MSKDDEYDYLFKGSNPPALALYEGSSLSTVRLLLLTFVPPEACPEVFGGAWAERRWRVLASSCADWRLRRREVKPPLALHPQRVQPRVQEHHWCAPRPPGHDLRLRRDQPHSSPPPQVSSSRPDRSRWTARPSKRRSGTQVPPPHPRARTAFANAAGGLFLLERGCRSHICCPCAAGQERYRAITSA